MINTDPNHKHIYDEHGEMICCSLEEKINRETDDHDDHNHGDHDESAWKQYIPSLISFVLLATGIILDNFITPGFFTDYIRLAFYVIAYLPVGVPVIKDAVLAISKGAFFSEFFLMSIATIGAFFIQEYAEGVAVMLFYAIGELFQSAAVNRAKRSIKALLDVRPDTVSVIRNGQIVTVSPSVVQLGEIIQVKNGEKVALDGELISENAFLNTSALTGESVPETKISGELILAGMINLQKVIEVKVTALFQDSKLSRILEMVQEATSRKAPTQLFIAKFAKIYTPIVVFLAVGICLLPYFFVADYSFNDWLYRSLVFLVISCPCALVISIPLGYFGGIGLASKNGILFKGSNYLDALTKIDMVVMDKTGTLTKGVFKVQKVHSIKMEEQELLGIAAAIESKSTHPIAHAIVTFAGNLSKNALVESVEEIPGHGLNGIVDGNEVLAGNAKLLRKFNVIYDPLIDSILDSIVVFAVNGQYVGYITVADELKEDAKQAIAELNNLNLRVVVLSGDKQSTVDKIARELNIQEAFGSLLPEEKVNKVQQFKNENRKLIFVGDGINDAPVIALSDVGVAMGGLGSDATIETADVVIQNDMPSKITTAIKISKLTRLIVLQNITMALSIKIVVLILGAGGLATLWEAVFADVGVALLAILNAVRIQRKKF